MARAQESNDDRERADTAEPPSSREGQGPASRPAPACEPGTMVDHFKVIRLLGAGAMGDVHLAYDTELGRRVALKMVTGELLGSEQAIERFLFEARTTARFNHPNIVTVYAAGRHEGRPYVALEYLEGQNLRQRISERPPGLQESLRIVLAIVEALEEAHGHGVLHRDLKPENVVVPLDGRLRVVDFGLAKLLAGANLAFQETVDYRDVDGPGEAQASGPGSVRGLKGTPAYMAPEQWLEEECSAATDVWALGVILFELCMNRLPFDCRSLAEQAALVCGPTPAPALDSSQGLPAELGALVARCLDKDSSFRPGAAVVAAELRELLQDRPTGLSGRESPFRGLLPFTARQAGLFFGRDAEIAAFVERVRLHPVLPVVGPSGAGKSSFVQAGIIPRLQEQEPWIILRLRPGSQPLHALAGRLLRADAWEERDTVASLALAATLHTVDPESSADQAGDDGPESDSDGAGAAVIDGGTLPGLGGETPSIPAPSSAAGTAAGAAEAAVDPDDEQQKLAVELLASPGRLSLRLRNMAEARQAKVLLFVDQLEELFTLVDDESARAGFLQALCTAAADPLDPVRVVFTVREDFLGRLATSAEAREALTQVTVIQRLDRAALEQTLLSPLEAAGYQFDDPSLPSDMVASVLGEPAGLPLLQFAAQLLWERRDGTERLLLRSAYEEIGGVEGALAKHADGVLDGLSSAELELARALLLRLVTAERTRKVIPQNAALVGLGAGDSRGEAGGDPSSAMRVLARLTEARLVSVSKVRGGGEGEATLELAHESLIRTWGTLSRWIDESQEDLAFIAEVDQAAELWDRRGRLPDELWRAGALVKAERMAARCADQLPVLAAEFLDAARGRERRRIRRRQLAIVSAIAGSATVAIIAVLVAWFVADQERQTREQRDRANEREAQAQQQRVEALREGARAALGHGNLLEARAKLRVALESEREQASSAARVLWWQLERNPLVWRKRFGAAVYAVAFSPDGTSIAAACQDGAVYLLDPRTRGARTLRGHVDQVLAAAFSPDGQRLATASWSGELRLWDVRTGAEQGLLRGHSAGVLALAFSPDGKLLASGNLGHEVRLWDVAKGESERVLSSGGEQGSPADLSFSPDGRRLAAAGSDGTVRIWDLADGEQRATCQGHGASVLSVDFSPDGQLLASSSMDATIRLWEATAASCEPGRVLSGHSAGIYLVRFSPDGKLLASGSGDSSVRLWDAHNGEQRRFFGHRAAVWEISFSPDGKLLASGSDDGSVRLWHTDRGERKPVVGAHAAPVWHASFSPDGKLLASGSSDKTVRLWDVRSGRPKAVFDGHTAGIHAVSFSPDGKLLASGGDDRSVRLWEVGAGKQQRMLTDHTSAVHTVAFSPAGDLFATAGLDKSVRLYELPGARPRGVLSGHTAGILGVSFSPDGKLLASGSTDRSVRLWDLRSGMQIAQLAGHSEQVWEVSFGPEGRWLVSTGADGTVRRWNVQSGLGDVLGTHPVRGYGVAYHPDGERVVSSGAAGSVYLWAVASPSEPIPLGGHRGDVNAVALSADGRLAATAGDDNTLRLWSTDTARPAWHAPVLLGAPPRLWSHRGWEHTAAGAEPKRLDPEADELGLGPRARKAIEQDARHATENSGSLCLRSHDGKLELWDLRADRLVVGKALPGLEQSAALPSGCVGLADGLVWLLTQAREERQLTVEGRATAVSFAAGQLLLATPARVQILSETGQARTSYEASPGTITAVTGGGLAASEGAAAANAWVAVGYREGNIELLAPPPRGRLAVSFERVPASQPVRMLPGPRGTLIVGYANGFVGLWSLDSGSQLASGRLHGPVVHLLLDDHRLVAATELGDQLVWELSALHLDDCELLRQVWARVPVLWRDGRAETAPAPTEHRCAQTP